MQVQNRNVVATNSVFVAIAGEVVNRRFVHLRKIVLNGQYGVSKLATKHTTCPYIANNLIF